MLNVLYLCVTQEHDFRFVLLAAFICIFDCLTGINLFVRARESTGSRRSLLVAGAALVFSTGVWATHFVAELAFKPGLPVAYDFNLTLLSLLVAIVLVWPGMAVALRFERPLEGGALMGAAIGAMHYTGVAALRVPADLHWDPAFVAISVMAGMLGAGLAMQVVCRNMAWRNRVAAAGLLVAAICVLHFAGMAAITLVPDPRIAIPSDVIAPEILATLVAASTIAIVMLGMAAAIVDEQSARRATGEAEKLRRSEEHLARAQRIAGVGSMEIDLQTGRIELSSEARAIFGIEAGGVESTREALLDFVHPADRAAVAHTLTAAAEARRELEFRIVRPNGAVRAVYGESETVAAASRLLTLKDITDVRAAEARQKELEQQLLHSQKLEALGTLAGGIAHDLNNTLVPILSLSKLALDDLPDGSQLREDIATIVAASERARDLVKQILAFSRKQAICKAETDPAAVVRQALQMLRATLPANIALVEEIAAVPAILADGGQLQQVIVNLVTNAAHAIGTESGAITVAVAAEAGAPGAPGGRCVCIRVADTGCGMPKEIVERIFEPFFTTKQVGEGTGLGLAVVHGIVTGHGGTIAVGSTPGQGTAFTIALPVPEPAPVALAAAA